MSWHRKRHPEDVPTPVAVALSDYCRRAKAPASPGLVRDALALLGPDDDARVRQLADGEPPAKLGPFGVVDLLLGTALELAVERQSSGFYDDARRQAEDSAVPELLERSAPMEPQPAPRADAPPAAESPKKRTSMKAKIAPVRRKAGEAPKRAVPKQSLPGTAYLPRRTLPQPRGRFTTVDSTRSSFESLFRPDGKEIITTLLAQVPHRVALLRTLEQGYASRRGTPLSVGDVEDLLEAHALFDAIEEKEREGVVAAVLDNRGSLGRAAHGFGLKPPELEQLIEVLGLEREVDEIRARFIKEALDPNNLALRLELVFRSRCLEDLGIDRRFTESLTKELRKLVNAVKDDAPSTPTLIDLLSRQHALPADSLRRALEKLGLLEI